jgi:hypothetical protein
MWARRYLGLSLLGQGRVDEGQALLSASPVAYGPLLGANLLFGAQINILCEAWGVRARGRWDSDIAGRARNAMERFPEHLRRGMIERARQRALKAPTADSLHVLITLCNRIA